MSVKANVQISASRWKLDKWSKFLTRRSNIPRGSDRVICPAPCLSAATLRKSLTLDSLLTLKRCMLVLVNIWKYLWIFECNSSWESVEIGTQTTGRCSCLKAESRSKSLVHDLELLELMHALGPPLLNLFLSEECRWWNFAIRTSFRAALFFYLPQKKNCNPHIYRISKLNERATLTAIKHTLTICSAVYRKDRRVFVGVKLSLPPRTEWRG